MEVEEAPRSSRERDATVGPNVARIGKVGGSWWVATVLRGKPAADKGDTRDVVHILETESSRIQGRYNAGWRSALIKGVVEDRTRVYSD